RQREQARAIALFLAAIPVSNVLGAPVSGFILDHAHWLDVSSWRWLLITEGGPAIIVGIVIYFFLPSRPAEAEFLTDDEKQWLLEELAREENQKLSQRRISAVQALANGRVWHLASILFTLLIGFYAMSFWMPQVVKSLSTHYSNTTVGFLVMIPHLA